VRCLFDQEQETPAGQAQFVRRRSAVTGVFSLLRTVSLSGELGAPACLLRVRLGGGFTMLWRREKSPGGGRKRTVCRRLSSTVWWRASGVIWGTLSDIETRMRTKIAT
jgi:hypothetical protein